MPYMVKGDVFYKGRDGKTHISPVSTFLGAEGVITQGKDIIYGKIRFAKHDTRIIAGVRVSKVAALMVTKAAALVSSFLEAIDGDCITYRHIEALNTLWDNATALINDIVDGEDVQVVLREFNELRKEVVTEMQLLPVRKLGRWESKPNNMSYVKGQLVFKG